MTNKLKYLVTLLSPSSTITQIIDIMLKSLNKKLSDQNIEITLSDEAKEFISKAGYDPIYGARALKRAIYDILYYMT